MLLDKRPPCVLYQSFLVLFVFVHDAPNKGNASSGNAFCLMGISPLPGSLRGALIGCDGSRHFLCRFNARPVTEHKYHYCFCLSWPSVRMRRTVRLKGRVAHRLSPTAEGR